MARSIRARETRPAEKTACCRAFQAMTRICRLSRDCGASHKLVTALAEVVAAQVVLFHQSIERAARQLGFQSRRAHVSLVSRQQLAQKLLLEAGQVFVPQPKVA